MNTLHSDVTRSAASERPTCKILAYMVHSRLLKVQNRLNLLIIICQGLQVFKQKLLPR